MLANRMARALDLNQWQITIVDEDETHYYQPGFLFIPFGKYDRKDVIRPKRNYLPDTVTQIYASITGIDPANKRVALDDGAQQLAYDYLFIATGAQTVPAETPGLLESGWRRDIFDFYTADGATALQAHLRNWTGGRLVVHIAEMPIKCPVAPLEFLFLADAYFQQKGMRDRVELTLATPLPGAFTKPKAAELLAHVLDEKRIAVVPEFAIERVDPDARMIHAYDGRTVDYDLLVSVPVNMGAAVMGEAGLGDDLNFVPTDKHTLLAKGYDNIFVFGDATDLPSSKAGSVAHFQVEGFVENFLRYLAGKPLEATFDGHANCYVESGHGKGFLIDFNYDVEPLPGKYPLPGVGPFTLLEESRVNHWGKLAFRWIYWNMLLKGRPLPVPTRMSMLGKRAA